MLVGAALYAVYVVPRDGFEWHYAQRSRLSAC
jgi:hypothetical protein